jgi:hypothetical protein
MRGLSVGVVWGEGEGTTNQRGQAAGADISDWIERLIRAVWRRLFFIHGGEG